jgi:propanediol utilization protein
MNLDLPRERIVELVAAEVARATGLRPVATMGFDIPVGISARHVHLCAADFALLFGPGLELTRTKDLSQPGQFACEQKVTVLGPKGAAIEGVRILGPLRQASQVELSATDARSIGLAAPLRESGDLSGAAWVVMVGPQGALRLPAAIVARRHVHMSPADAERYGVGDREVLSLELEGERGGIFGHVVCRVSPSFALDFHLDTDEANAFGVGPHTMARIAGRQDGRP